MVDKELKLHEHDRVAIIGAGPAGSLFAYFLLRLAKQKNLRLQVTLYDPLDFTQVGPTGCNGCVGVINGSLWHRLQNIGIDPDQTEGLIQSRLKGYLWSTPNGCIRINLPKNEEPIRTVFRGSGPRFGHLGKNISFDQYLLQRALAEGAQHQQARVCLVERLSSAQGVGSVQLTLEKDHRQWQEQAELVVGAFGLNPFLMKQFEPLGIDYHPPKSVRAAQIELTRRPGIYHPKPPMTSFEYTISPIRRRSN